MGSKISSSEYVKLNKGITDRTARRDLMEMIEFNVLVKKGSKKDAYYERV